MESSTNSINDAITISNVNDDIDHKCLALPEAENWDVLYLKSIITKIHEHLRTTNANEYHEDYFDIKTITRLFNSIKDTEKRKSIGGRFLSYLMLRPKMCSSLDQYHNRLIALIKSIPDSTKFTDEDGMTPLHHYCSFNSRDVPPNLDVLEQLLDAYPRSPLQLNKYKETPLHQYASLDNPDPRVILCILKFCPMAASTISNKQLPIHAMLSPRYRDTQSYVANIRSIKALMLVYPESIIYEVTDDSLVMEFINGENDASSVTVQTRRTITWSPILLAFDSDIVSKAITDTMSLVALRKTSY